MSGSFQTGLEASRRTACLENSGNYLEVSKKKIVFLNYHQRCLKASRRVWKLPGVRATGSIQKLPDSRREVSRNFQISDYVTYVIPAYVIYVTVA
jgi:hypothetical protein